MAKAKIVISDRRAKVLDLLRLGESNQTIAEVLQVGRNTVRDHIKALGKVGLIRWEPAGPYVGGQGRHVFPRIPYKVMDTAEMCFLGK